MTENYILTSNYNKNEIAGSRHCYISFHSDFINLKDLLFQFEMRMLVTIEK